MKTFEDADKRLWEVVVNVNSVKRVRDLARVDLLDAAAGNLLERLADDPCLLVNVLYALCKPQADALKIGDEDFGRAMIGGVLDAAASALVEDLLDFFPRAQRVRSLGRLVTAGETRAVEMAAARAAVTRLATADEKPSIPGGSSTSAPAPSALTPAP